LDFVKKVSTFDLLFQVVSSDSNLDKIVGDFIKVEDQNFALFNYVTEMNNQVYLLAFRIHFLSSSNYLFRLRVSKKVFRNFEVIFEKQR